MHCAEGKSRTMRHYREVAYLLLRVTVGAMFFFYGAGKFIQGLSQVASGFGARFAESPLPSVLAEAFGFVLPFLEVALGTLLILGLFTRTTLIAAQLETPPRYLDIKPNSR